MNTNEPTAWIREDGVIAFHPKIEVDSQGFKWFPLYLQPQKYCPSENNVAYEKGVIDGMAKMTESAVHRAVEGMAVRELTDKEIYDFTHRMIICSGQNPSAADINIFGLTRIVEDILRKAQEK